MEVDQISSPSPAKRKRKILNSEHNVKSSKVFTECEDKKMLLTKEKVSKTSINCQTSDLKSIPSHKPEKKHFKRVNKIKSKVGDHFKENGSSTTTVSLNQTDVPVSEERNDKYLGTNRSGLIKKPRKEYEKDQNENNEKKILLARIQRKGVCSNWKTFKEIVKKDESIDGQTSEINAKKTASQSSGLDGHKNHRKNFKHKNELSLCSISNSESVKCSNIKQSDYKTEKAVENGFNGVKTVTANGDPIKLKKPNSSYFHKEKKFVTGVLDESIQQQTVDGTPHKNSMRLTKQIALDCEMVGTEDNSDMVARVSLVNKFGECLYDKFVAPTEKVLDYRTWVSGIRPENLKNAEDFKQVQKEVADLLQGRLLVGHAVRNDLKVLFLSHPRKYTRDTQRFKLFRELAKTKRPSLKKLASTILNVSIQEGEHSSVEDAKVAMQLYMLYQKKWEKLLRKSKKKLSTPKTTAVPTN